MFPSSFRKYWGVSARLDNSSASNNFPDPNSVFEITECLTGTLSGWAFNSYNSKKSA
jgi:hypothetical protein